MFAIIKRILVVFALTISTSAIASGLGAHGVNNPCDDIYVNGDLSSSFSPRVICNQDLMATSLNMLFSDSYYKAESLQSAYRQAGLPSPDLTGGQFDSLGGMVTAMSTAMIQIFLFIALPFFGLGLTLKALDTLKQEEWSSSMKKPEVWGSGVYFMTMVILATVVDGVMIGQTVVVIAAGVGLGFANQLMTALLPSFSFSTSVTNEAAGIEPFLQEGKTYAERVVTGLQGARDSAVFLASAATPSPKDEVEYLKPSSRNVDYVAPGFFDKHYDDRDVTVFEYANQLLTSKAVSINKTSILADGLSLGGVQLVNSAGTTQYTLVSGRSEGDRLLKEYIKNDIHAADIFDDEVVYTASSGVPPIGAKALKELASNKFGLDTNRKLFNLNEISSDDVMSASKPIIEYITNMADEEDVTEIARTVPYFMLGVYDEDSVSRGSAFAKRVRYNPRAFSPLAPTSNQVEASILNAAINATNHFTASACAMGLKSESTAGRVLADALYAKSLKSNPAMPASSLDDFAIQSNLQCFVFDNGTPKFMLESLFSNLPSDVLNLEIPEPERILMLKESIQKIDSFGRSEADKGREQVDRIANYYAAVKAISSNVALKQVESTNGDETVQVLTDLRKQGVGALHAYFFQIASIMKIYREQYLKAASVVIEHSMRLDDALLTNELKTEEDLGVLDRFLGSNLEDLKEKGGVSFVPVGSTTNKALIGNDSTMVAFDGDMEDAKFSDIAGRVLEGFLTSSLVPLTVLKNGFGFDEDKSMRENYKDCSTITNCVDISGHPLVIMSEFGKDMFYNSMFTLILDYIIQELLVNAIIGQIEKIESFATATMGPKGGWLTSIGLKVLGLEFLILILKVIAAISGIFAAFAKILIVAGLLLGFVLPVLPLLTGLFLWVGWLFEVFIMYIIFPIIAFLALIRIDGKPIITFGTFVSMLASIVLKPMLYVVAFMGLFSLSYVMFYLVNSVMYHLYNQVSAEGANFILSFAANQLSLALVVFIYFKILVKVNNEMAQVPEHVCNYIGVKSFSAVAATGVEQMIAASAIGKAVQSFVPPSNLKDATKRRKEKDREKAQQKQDNDFISERYGQKGAESEQAPIAQESSSIPNGKGSTSS